jgi:hypothetical protein
MALCRLPRAYRSFNHPRALAQGDEHARPALTGCPIGRHCYLEVLDASQVLDDFAAIAAPHVDTVQEKKSGAHVVCGSPSLYKLGDPPGKRDKPGRGPELSGFVGGLPRVHQPYVFGLHGAIKIQANLASLRLSY